MGKFKKDVNNLLFLPNKVPKELQYIFFALRGNLN